MKDNYDDIINLTHYEPKHKRMSIYNRSAQFAPFAALTGYSDNIKEASRITDKKIIIDEYINEELNYKLIYLNSIIKDNPFIEIIYFVNDIKKDGGKYISKEGRIKRIDFLNRFIKFNDNFIVLLDDIKDIIIK